MGSLIRLFRQSSSYSSRKKIVILGTGWGSYSALKNINKNTYDVVVVSPRNHFLFTPLLASTTVGTLEFRSIIEPIRNDPNKTYDINYDYLIIGVGAVSNTLGVPGVQQHAFFLKEVSDAQKIRDRILDNFELALREGASEDEMQRLLHTVIVGGGPTGVEFGAELHDFIQQDVSRLYKSEAKLVKVTLIESNKILGSFDKSVRLANGEVLPCGLVVWSTGIAPRPFTNSLSVPKTKHGQILTDDHLRVLDVTEKNVFALGDCAQIQNLPLPCTAQVAEKQGKYVADYLNALSAGKIEFPPFKFTSLGMLAYIGDYQALSDLPEVKLRGYTSWFVWRSAYLTRLGSWRLRMQVPLDWTKTLLFGRDISRF
ncbi:hypothetical protein CHUAL_005877 [Chamberlinius hualienensis]